MSNFECQVCKKNFKTKQNLEIHNTRCKVQKSKKEESMITEVNVLKDQVSHLSKEIKILKEQHQTQITFLETQLARERELVDELHEQLYDIAKQPTQTFNNQRTLNIVNQLAPYDLTAERAKAIVEAKFDEKVVKKGENGLLDFVVDHLLTDESSGKPKILCTDLARKIGKHLGADGHTLVKDVGLTHTIDVITPSLCSATHSVLNQWGDRQQKSNYRPTATPNGTPPMTPRDYSFYYERGMNNIVLMGNKGRFSSQLAGRLVTPESNDCSTTLDSLLEN